MPSNKITLFLNQSHFYVFYIHISFFSFGRENTTVSYQLFTFLGSISLWHTTH